jgi:hypothetical protein
MMRERKKKQKADEKRQKRLERKAAAEESATPGESTGEAPNSERDSIAAEAEHVEE